MVGVEAEVTRALLEHLVPSQEANLPLVWGTSRSGVLVIVVEGKAGGTSPSEFRSGGLA